MNSIGIDLGTTNSLIAVWEESNQAAKLIPNITGSVITPSAVSILEDGSVVVGQAAYERRLTHPHLTATEFKRDIGSTREFTLGKHQFSAEQLSSLVLSALKADAEASLGMPIEAAVISVPAYFNDTQRKATLVAADLAELNVTALINEPTAAALSYGLGQDSPYSCTTLVFDLGGGTFDVSLVDFFEGIVEIKASTGDNYLGGEDFTTAIAALIAEKAGISSKAASEAANKAMLRSTAERVKRGLSRQPTFTTKMQYESQELEVSVTEKELELCCKDLLDRIKNPVTRALRDSHIEVSSLDEVVLVGGTTRMPIVRKLVSKILGRFPNTSINPDEAIALGCATQAALVARNESLKEVLLTDVCPYSLGIEILKQSESLLSEQLVFSPIIERNTLLPVSRESIYTTTRDNQPKIELTVYQGEHRYVKDNIKLGSVMVKVPKKPAREIAVAVRFTYDVSGVLDVDATVLQTEEVFSKTLTNNAVTLSKKEISARRTQLQKLKIHPRESIANKTLIERATRLYAELSSIERQQVGDALDSFVEIVNSQDLKLIERKRKDFSDWLDQAEDILN